MYKSYHYDNMPRLANPSPEPQKTVPQIHSDTVPDNTTGHTALNKIFANLKNDDIILLIIIFILLIDDCDDKLLLIALGFIFFSGLGE